MNKEFISLEENEIDLPHKIIKANPIEIEEVVTKPTKVFETIKQDDVIILADKTLFSCPELDPEKFIADLPEELLTVYCNEDASTTYGEFDPNGYFKRDNLFSELLDDYERSTARMNLGIAEAYAMKWGNMTGNIIHQEDLYHFVMDNIHLNIQDLINALNTQLTAWATDIQRQINSKANIDSPSFIGVPTVPTPPETSCSGLIANTAWVTERIEEIIFQDLLYFNIVPSLISWEELPVITTLRWKFNTSIKALTINDISVHPTITEYSQIIHGSTNIKFVYTLPDDTIRTKDVFIEVRIPTYYGPDLEHLQSTLNDVIEFSTKENQHHYIVSEKLNLDISHNGIIGGFINDGSITIKGKMFYVYKSFNCNLGRLKIKLL